MTPHIEIDAASVSARGVGGCSRRALLELHLQDPPRRREAVMSGNVLALALMGEGFFENPLFSLTCSLVIPWPLRD